MFNPFKIIYRDIRSRIPVKFHLGVDSISFCVGPLDIFAYDKGDGERINVNFGGKAAAVLLRDEYHIWAEVLRSSDGVYRQPHKISLAERGMTLALFSRSAKQIGIGSLRIEFVDGAAEDAGFAKYHAERAVEERATVSVN